MESQKIRSIGALLLSLSIACFLLASFTTIAKINAEERIVYKYSDEGVKNGDLVVLACEYEGNYFALNVSANGSFSVKSVNVENGYAEGVDDTCVFSVEESSGDMVLLKSKSTNLYLAKPTGAGFGLTDDPEEATFSSSAPYNWTNGALARYYYYNGERIAVTTNEEQAGNVFAFVGETKIVVEKITLYGKDGAEYEEIDAGTSFPDYDWGENGVFLGWSNGKKLFKAGSDSPEEAENYFAVGVGFAPDKGASVRVMESSSESGIRFTLSVNSDDFEDALPFISEYGAIISPTDIFEGVCNFDLDDLTVGKTVVMIKSTKSYTENDELKYSVALIKINPVNYDREFSVRGYMKIVYDDGEEFVYSGYSKENNSRSIRMVAEMVRSDGYKDLSDKQIAIVDSYISNGDEL
ncbi:MAG: hypothetical protein IJ800_05705 [Clostridia bacterium]|nr:hypothetical protein [Clostridia bacterium]